MQAICFEEERRRQLCADYTATTLGMIGKLLGGETWTMPSYIEMAYPDKAAIDTRSAEEIKADILRRLTE